MPSREMVFESGASNLTRSRSKFDLSQKNTFTMVAGLLYPFDVYSDVLPGDTIRSDVSLVCRSTTPITAVMDDAYLQVEFWWVPNQMLLSRASMSPSVLDAEHSWRAFFGAQDNLLNVGLLDAEDPILPMLPYDGTSVTYDNYRKSLAHFLDYPYLPENITNVRTNSNGARHNRYFNPFAMLAFYQVWSDAYREPNLWNPVTYSIQFSGSTPLVLFTTNSDAGIVGTNVYGNGLPHICREHGYFGSALPWPQRNLNPAVIKLGEPLQLSVGDDYDVQNLDGTGDFVGMGFKNLSSSYRFPLNFVGGAEDAPSNLIFYTNGGTAFDPDNENLRGINRMNLYADLSKVGSITINTLRYSFALQAYYEALGRMGNRYDDIIRMYGVSVSRCDSCSAEYLGGKRIPLTQSQVVASAAANSPVGSIGGFSNTSDFDHYFTKSFNDFGVIVGCCFIRHHDSVWNRLSRERSRVSRFDYYQPYFARIGEVAVYRNELFVNPNTVSLVSDSVVEDYVANPEFGFQEYGADYRYREDTIHGEVIPGLSYGYWTYGPDWKSILGDALNGDIDDLTLGNFLDGSLQRLSFDQTLQTSSSTAGFQFVVQFYNKMTAVRNIYAHSIPAVLGAR